MVQVLMERPSPTQQGGRPPVWTVDQLTNALKSTIEQGFPQVVVEGEVVSCRPSSAGHVYFSLKGRNATLPAVVFRSTAQRYGRPIRNGDRLIVGGGIEVYAPHGRYQLVVNWVRAAGEGDLLAALAALKRQLHAEGLFAPERKRPLPFIPRRIGLVTAHTGAAVRDMIRSIHIRFPASILVAASPVQGEGAALVIIDAMFALAAIPDVDVIVIGRGGGSLEDLWQFNHEGLVRAIANCPKPVISAVGHEIDTPLTDLVADVRAATPTAVGELVVPIAADLRAHLDQLRSRAARAVNNLVRHERTSLTSLARRLGDPRRSVRDRWLRLDDLRERLDHRTREHLARQTLRLERLRLRLVDPRTKLAQQRQHLTNLGNRLLRAIESATRAARARHITLHNALLRRQPEAWIGPRKQQLQSAQDRLFWARQRSFEKQRSRLLALHQRLATLSPTAVLDRGYSIVQSDDGRVIRCYQDVEVGQSIAVRLATGTIDATVRHANASAPQENR
ncbi:MAG: exodeoxyribonuclease VII large subunit [Myxococcota bacterium]|jgi:exodeoxyribonuclease VII large subunit